MDPDWSRYLQVGRDRQAGFVLQTTAFDEAQVRTWRDRVVAALEADGRVWAGESALFR
jgi:hypothetical protein